MLVDTFMVQGVGSSHDQINHAGTSGRRRAKYHASKHKLANDRMLRRMYGASGRGKR